MPIRFTELGLDENGKFKRPRKFQVILRNDGYTGMDFVVQILQDVFHHSESEARRLALEVHSEGAAVAGIYTYEIAETKVAQVSVLAGQHEFPFVARLAPE